MAKMFQWIVWVGAASMAVGCVAPAQSAAACTTPAALGAVSTAPIPTIGVPYSVTMVTSHDQTLADGSVVHSSVTTYKGRDAAGRLAEERSLGCQPGPDGARHAVIERLVYDPASGTTLSWKVDDPEEIIHVLHEAVRAARPTNSGGKGERAAVDRRAAEELGIDPGEDLGSRKIAGVMAEGRRTVSSSSGGHKVVAEVWV